MVIYTVLYSAIGVAILCLCIIAYKRREYVNAINKIPGLPLKPIIGNLDEVLCSPEEIWLKMRAFAREYYPIYKIWVLHVCIVVLLSPEDIQILLSSSTCITKGSIYRSIEMWLKTGLITSDGEKWQNRRKILTPTLHFNILADSVKTFVKEAEILVQKIHNECSKPYTDVVPLISECTLRIITETAMGTQLDPQNPTEQKYCDSLCRIGEIAAYRIVRPWLHPDFMYMFSQSYREEKRTVNFLHQFSRSIVKKRIEELKPADFNDKLLEGRYTRKRRLAMLDLLIKHMMETGEIDEEGIREEVDAFLFAEEVRKEIKDTLGENTGPLTMKDVQALPYLEMVIKESLRLYPSVPTISRNIIEPITTSSGYYIPEGTEVAVDIQSLHLNPRYWPDPNKFDPNRFLPDNTKHRHPFSYLPFSAGPRNCIGQKFAMLEMKIILVSILRNFRLLPEDTPETIVHRLHFTNESVHGIKVKFRKLENSN